jgi:hypothetical protein
MLYADLLAIYNAIAEKPVTGFDTRANGIRRIEVAGLIFFLLLSRPQDHPTVKTAQSKSNEITNVSAWLHADLERV